MRSQVESVEQARVKVLSAYQVHVDGLKERRNFKTAIEQAWKSVFAICTCCGKTVFKDSDVADHMCACCKRYSSPENRNKWNAAADVPQSVMDYAGEFAKHLGGCEYKHIATLYNQDIEARLDRLPIALDNALNLWMGSSWTCRVCGETVDLLFTALFHTCSECRYITGTVCQRCNGIDAINKHDMGAEDPKHARFVWDHVARYENCENEKQTDPRMKKMVWYSRRGYFPGGPTDLRCDAEGKSITLKGDTRRYDLNNWDYRNRCSSMIFAGAPAEFKPPHKVMELL
jgi:hypothetical protein